MKLSPIVDHAYLLNVTKDQHHARDHKARHQKGGADDLESLLQLANFSDRSHNSLTNVAPSQHHVKTSKLSEITIDVDKDWAGKAINSPGNVDGVDISAHAANADAHHTKFTITEHDTTARHSLGTVVPHDALASLTEKAHGSLTGVTASQHHTKTVAGELNLADLAEKSHGSLTGVTSDQHHPQSHTLASHSTKAHSELTGVGANDHHAQSHTLASHSTKAHTELTGVTASQHHAKYTNAEAVSAVAAADDYVKNTGDNMTGNLTLSAGKTVDGVDISAHATNANAHHPQAHTLASHSTKAHSELTGVTAAQHHAKTVSGDIDHGSVGGLTDDDHTQYYNQSRGDARYLRKGINLDLGAYYIEAKDFRHNSYDVMLQADNIRFRCRDKANSAYRDFLANRFYIAYRTMWFTGDHGELVGRGDDDHTQYLLANGTRTLTGNLAVSSGKTVDGVDISAHAANADAHHAQVHTLASHSTKAHSELTGVTSDQHHTKFTIAEHDTTTRHSLGTVVPHDALASLTEKAHGSLTGVTASQHHTKTASGDIDHGSVGGLTHDDHTQYLNTTRHDTTTRHPVSVIKTSQGSATGSVPGLGNVCITMNVKSLFPSVGAEIGIFMASCTLPGVQYTSQFRLYNSYEEAKNYYVGWYYLS